ncbi:MAG: hypothetical protein AAF635_08485 [Cyanobacteria bacterium P01_C01_bin.69]
MPQALLQWRSPLKAMAMPAGSDGNARWKRSARRAQSDRIDLSWVFQGRLHSHLCGLLSHLRHRLSCTQIALSASSCTFRSETASKTISAL